ncbi:tubulin-tyrosine ligase family-domain-containing protein [Zopfochytrium polystomum]|nr:tubulin-tyrosine ligase family-domain-containing protein [Zopfochytrium polystomum]
MIASQGNNNQDVAAPESSSPPRLCYRMAETGPPLLKAVLEKRGWCPYIEDESPYWNLWWRGSRFRISEYSSCRPWQRLNHFPKTALITRKDCLFRTLKTMRGIYGAVFDFVPQTFLLPNDYVRFIRVYAEEEEKGEKGVWICKPADLSRGRKIFVFRDLQDLTYDCNAILQRYIPNPMLISGYKFDLRCYVLVRSYDPLNIYLYDEGLTRFATSPYDITSLKNRYSHLTNTSINKFSPTLLSEKDQVGQGCKWNLAKFQQYCAANDLPFARIWQRIKAIVILTLLPVAAEVRSAADGCFELYGFDILLDDALRPWLLEVNMSPALSVDSEVDVEVKEPLLSDVIALLELSVKDAQRAKQYSDLQDALNASKTRRKPESPPPPSTLPAPIGQPPATTSNRSPFPQQVGGFRKIFPFNDVTAKANMMKQGTMRHIIQEVKRKWAL